MLFNHNLINKSITNMTLLKQKKQFENGELSKLTYELS